MIWHLTELLLQVATISVSPTCIAVMSPSLFTLATKPLLDDQDTFSLAWMVIVSPEWSSSLLWFKFTEVHALNSNVRNPIKSRNENILFIFLLFSRELPQTQRLYFYLSTRPIQIKNVGFRTIARPTYWGSCIAHPIRNEQHSKPTQYVFIRIYAWLIHKP